MGYRPGRTWARGDACCAIFPAIRAPGWPDQDLPPPGAPPLPSEMGVVEVRNGCRTNRSQTSRARCSPGRLRSGRSTLHLTPTKDARDPPPQRNEIRPSQHPEETAGYPQTNSLAQREEVARTHRLRHLLEHPWWGTGITKSATLLRAPSPLQALERRRRPSNSNGIAARTTTSAALPGQTRDHRCHSGTCSAAQAHNDQKHVRGIRQLAKTRRIPFRQICCSLDGIPASQSPLDRFTHKNRPSPRCSERAPRHPHRRPTRGSTHPDPTGLTTVQGAPDPQPSPGSRERGHRT